MTSLSSCDYHVFGVMISSRFLACMPSQPYYHFLERVKERNYKFRQVLWKHSERSDMSSVASSSTKNIQKLYSFFPCPIRPSSQKQFSALRHQLSTRIGAVLLIIVIVMITVTTNTTNSNRIRINLIFLCLFKCRFIFNRYEHTVWMYLLVWVSS